jgi:hypothetical protein
MNSTCSKGSLQGRRKGHFDTSKLYMTPPSLPSYAAIQKDLKKGEGTSKSHPCDICDCCHPLKELCKSKPRFPPSAYFPKCEICYGYHPKYHCYFEKLREVLFTQSFCEYCSITHIGFCNDGLLCQLCNRKHNFADGCVQQVSFDLSGNLCPRCESYHYLHCPVGLQRITSNVFLWCNRCKIEHNFMNCVPFCNRCFRRHREGICPPSWTFCRVCNYCHQGESCPRDANKTLERSSLQDIGATNIFAPVTRGDLASPFQDLEHYLDPQ